MASSEYESIITPADAPPYGYAQTYDPEAWRQTAVNGYGGGSTQGGQAFANANARANGQGRNRAGRGEMAFRNGNGGGVNGLDHRAGFARYPSSHAVPNQAYVNAPFPISPFQSSSGSQADVTGGLEAAASVDGGVVGDGSFHDGQGYHAMSGMVLPGMSPMMTGSQTSEQHLPNQQSAFQHPMSGIGIYPYSHLGHGGKLPGVNGNPGRLPGTLPNGSMDPAQMTGNYGPAAAAAAAAAAGNVTGRTVYVGNLPADASVDELMNLVRFGPVESVRILTEKSCVFISFLDGATAAAFHADATVKKLTLHGQELKIGWGHASSVPSQVIHAIAMAKATRNVYLGGLDESVTESQLRDDLSRFGPIDQVKIVRDKGIGFVHFLSITVAMRVVNTLPQEPAWQGKRIGYGKDRCAYVPRAQQAAVQAAQQQAAAALSHTMGVPGSAFPAIHPLSPAALYSADFSNPMFAQSGLLNAIVAGATVGRSPHGMGDYQNGGFGANGGHPVNRCLYIGNLPDDATTTDICEAIRGGLVLSIKYMPDKHYAFVSFSDPTQATHFYHQATSYGLTVKQKKVKVSWGRGNNFVHPSVLNAVMTGGATRIVYIGGIEDFDAFNEQRLRQDFEPFGEIEQINFLKDKKAAFVNFCDVRHASKALENIKTKPEYENLRLAYGKDRCANNPRPGHFGLTPRGPKALSAEQHSDMQDSQAVVPPRSDKQAEVSGDAASKVDPATSSTLVQSKKDSDEVPQLEAEVEGLTDGLSQVELSSGPNDATLTAASSSTLDGSRHQLSEGAKEA